MSWFMLRQWIGSRWHALVRALRRTPAEPLPLLRAGEPVAFRFFLPTSPPPHVASVLAAVNERTRYQRWELQERRAAAGWAVAWERTVEGNVVELRAPLIVLTHPAYIEVDGEILWNPGVPPHLRTLVPPGARHPRIRRLCGEQDLC